LVGTDANIGPRIPEIDVAIGLINLPESSSGTPPVDLMILPYVSTKW
jgi:hypothetical protein